MKSVFADSLYWIAITNPNDQYAIAAKQARQKLGDIILVTTDEVLTEFLAALSRGGSQLRQAAGKMVRKILENPNVRVIQQTRDGFLKGLDRYENRRDQEYSLTDCISMNVMEVCSITEVLTHDHHFDQEGFTVLIRNKK